MSEKSYELLCKMFSAIPERTKKSGKSGNREDQLSQITMQ